MTQEIYFSIAIILSILFFIFNFIKNKDYIFNIEEKNNIELIGFIFITIVLSLGLGLIWILLIPTIILYLIIKLIRYINWKKVWIEISELGHAAKLARDNQYNKQ